MNQLLDYGRTRKPFLSERDYCAPCRMVNPLPSYDQPLQISVKRCQELTLEALKMQRICSAALLAVFAIADAFSSCLEIVRRFDSRRLHFLTR